MTKLLYCAGEHARVVLDSLSRLGLEDDLVVVDDDETKHGTRLAGYDVIGGRGVVEDLSAATVSAHVALGGHGSARLELAESLETQGFRLFSVVDPDATVSPAADLGDGTYINAKSYVGPRTTLGKTVIVDSLANVSHDTHLGPGVTVTPGATVCGGAEIGSNAYIGAGATVLDHVRVGDGAVVGGGAVVTDNVAPETTVVGAPAEPLDCETEKHD